MPITLFHGPAGSGKRDALFKRLAHEQNSSPQKGNCQWVVPESFITDQYLKLWLETCGSSGLFASDFILPINQFLLKILKHNIPRMHEATPRFSRLALHSLLTSHNPFPATVEELRLFFVRIKKNGVGPDNFEKCFSKLETPQLIEVGNLFQAYQNLLQKTHAYDEGDLHLEFIRRLENRRLKLPPDLDMLVFDRIFPLSFGDRRILQLLAEQFPQLKIFITFSFDFAQKDDPYFYPFFTQLGEMASETKYFLPPDRQKSTEACVSPEPATELRTVVNQIREKLKKGAAPEDICVVVPPGSFYSRRLRELLEVHAIPFQPAAPLDLGAYWPPQIATAELVGLFKNFPDTAVKTHLMAAALLEKEEAEFEFEKDLLLQSVNPALIARWKEQEMKTVFSTPSRYQSGIWILPLGKACLLDSKITFVTGYTENNYPFFPREHSFLTQEMFSDPALREILEGPGFTTETQRHQLKHLADRSAEIYLSSPVINWNGAEESLSTLYPAPKPLITCVTPGKIFTLRSPQFPKLNKIPTSLSSLDVYPTCPYKFYAKEHLKLGEPDRDEEDVPGDIRGSFVHRVLERLLRENLNLYREAIDYDVYLNKLQNTAGWLAESMAADDAFLKHTLGVVRDSFITRTSRVIAGLLSKEIHQVRAGKKATLPFKLEWSFTTKFPGLDFPLSGRIDRIDVDEKSKSFSVIDYKTGNLPTIQKLKSGESFQLILYTWAVETLLLPGYRPSALSLVGLKELDKNCGLAIQGTADAATLTKTSSITDEEWRSLKESTANYLKSIVHKIKNGEFAPAPEEPRNCRTCAYRGICHFQPGEVIDAD